MVMKTNKILFIFMGMICCPSVNCDSIAYVGGSKIIGQVIQQSNIQVNQYLGIPYAEPPVGNLRFMKTKPLESFPEIFKAVHQPPACHQYSKNPFPWHCNTTEKSEDCLYLNIWTPADASPQNTKAVFYWIHGGGFQMGSIRDDLYSGIALAALGDIVVVTVNYRLGLFGFLSSGIDDAPGNAGLWDLLEGLRWVNRNILAFGGDSSRITIAGESAGSMAVALLSASPLSKGLFTRQIMQSGVPTTLVDKKVHERNHMLAQNLATHVGCANESYTINDYPSEVTRCLKDVDAVTLSQVNSPDRRFSRVGFYPQYGDDIIPTNSRNPIENGGFCSSEVLIGVNRDEGSTFLSTFNSEVFGFFGQKDSQINKTAGKDLIRNMYPTFPDPEALINHYLADAFPENAHNKVRRQVHKYLGDTIIICPSVYSAEKCAEKGSKVYFYFWVHRPSTSPWAPWMGATHFSEVQFVFGQPVLNPQSYQPEEVEISLHMIQTWSSFIKHGKLSIPWPIYSKDFPIFMYLGSETKVQDYGMGPHRQNCDFLRPYF